MARTARRPNIHRPQPDYLTPGEAADYLRLSASTLSHYRHQGRGPAYYKFGWRVWYRLEDLVSWTEGQRWISTSEHYRPAP